MHGEQPHEGQLPAGGGSRRGRQSRDPRIRAPWALPVSKMDSGYFLNGAGLDLGQPHMDPHSILLPLGTPDRVPRTRCDYGRASHWHPISDSEKRMHSPSRSRSPRLAGGQDGRTVINNRRRERAVRHNLRVLCGGPDGRDMVPRLQLPCDQPRPLARGHLSDATIQPTGTTPCSASADPSEKTDQSPGLSSRVKRSLRRRLQRQRRRQRKREAREQEQAANDQPNSRPVPTEDAIADHPVGEGHSTADAVTDADNGSTRCVAVADVESAAHDPSEVHADNAGAVSTQEVVRVTESSDSGNGDTDDDIVSSFERFLEGRGQGVSPKQEKTVESTDDEDNNIFDSVDHGIEFEDE